MSKTIDEKVVSIQFDNQRFEKNVSTTMSTLDKLKQKLNFNGASKGLESINTAASKVNMNGLGNAVEVVHSKFSALEVMGVTALANITNSAVNAGKRIVSALTIDPIKSGFEEYETKMGSIQTILANTQHAGTNLDDVTGALEELNLYADQTIYNFQEMTRNIGTFTAAGVDLDTSVQSIKGIANLAAVSGSTSQQASTAMYQLSQALAAGKVSLMDWNSVVNAGMGGKVFQDSLIRTSELLKTGAKTAIEEYGSFRESLTKGQWLTTEVLTETLKQLSGAYTEADLIAQGYTEEQAKEIFKLSQTATDAATKVKTFTQLFDTLKESAQSGWAQTWEMIFGDFEEAKEFFTGLSDTIGGFINGMSEYRNDIVSNVFGSNVDKLMAKINEAGIETSKYEEKVRSVAEAHFISSEEFDKIIEKHGSLSNAIKNGAISSNILKKALAELGLISSESGSGLGDFVDKLNEIKQVLGFGSIGDDVKTLQTALEKLGYSVGECKIDGIVGPDTTKAIKEFQEAAGIAVDGIAGPETLEALKKSGKSIKDISEDTKEATAEYTELIDNITDKGGRELFLEGFGNVIKSIVGILKSFGAAWSEIFPASGIQNGLLSAIELFNKFSQSLLLTEEVLDKDGNTIVKFNENGENLVRTLKGVFAILDIIATLTGSVFKVGIQIVQEFLKALGFIDVNILSITANVGDAIVAFRDWLDEHNLISKVISKIVPLLVKLGEVIFKLLKKLWELPVVQEFIGELADIFSTLEDKADTAINNVISWLENIDDITLDDVISSLTNFGKVIKTAFSNIDEKYFNGMAGDIISGLANGLKDGAYNVWNTIVNLANTLITKFKDILGIHSPSTVFFAIGGFIIAGLIGGLLGSKTDLFSTISEFASNIINRFTALTENIDWSTVFAGGMSIGLLIILKNLTDFLNNVSSISGSISGVFDNISDLVEDFNKSLKKYMKAKSFKTYTEGFRNIALSLLILAGAIALLTLLDIDKMRDAVGVILALSIILAGLSFTLSKLSSSSTTISRNGIQINGLKTSLLSLGIVMLLMAATMKIIGDMDPDEAKQGFLGLVGVVGAMAAIFFAFGKFIKGDAANNMDKAGKMISKISVAMLLMVGVIKLVSFLKEEELKKGANFIGGFIIFVGALGIISRIAGGNVEALGKMMTKMAFAMLLMVGVIKLISFLRPDELIKGAICMGFFVLFVGALVAVTKVGRGTEIAKVGGMLLSVAGAMLIMVLVVKLISFLEPDEILKGVITIALFGGIIAGLLLLVNSLGSSAPKIAGTILALSVGIAILAGVAIILSLISLPGLVKGVVAIGLLGSIMALMIYATKDANDVKGSIMAMAIAIGVMAASVAILSFIKPEKLVVATLALGILMGMFALIESQSKHVTGSMGCLIVMTVAIGVMAAALYILSGLPIDNMLASAISLSTLMLALSGCLFIIGKAHVSLKDALIGMAGLLLLCVPMVALVTILSKMQNIQNATTNAIILASLMTVLTILLVPLCIIGGIAAAFGGTFIIAGLLALAGMLVSMYILVDILIYMQNIQNASENANLLINLMSIMTGMLLILALIGPLALIGVVAMAGLTALIVAIGAMAIGMGALMQEFPQLESFIDKGIPILVKLATGIGEIVNGFVTGLVSGLPEIGAQLSAFMVYATPFILGAKMVDESVLAGVGILTGAILALTAADFIEGIVSFLNGGTSFATLGTELSNFMINAIPFILISSTMIDPSIMDGVKALAEAILILTGANILEAITSFFAGGRSLEDFGTQLSKLGTSLNKFVGNLGTFTDEQVTTVNCAAKAIKKLSEAASTIPNEGGLWASIVGENSLATFSSYLPGLGSNLNSFVTNLGTFTDEQVTTVDCAGRAIKALAEAASTIPNEGGLWASIVGDNSLATFGSKLPGLGSNLKNFIANLGTFGEENIATVDCACNAIKSLASAAESIPNEGGLWAKIAGDNSLATFASKLPGLGTNLKNFVGNLGTFNETQVTTVGSACRAITAISQLGKENMDIGNISDFGKKIETLAEKIKSFVSKIGEVGAESITSAIDKTKELIGMAKSIAGVNISSVSNFATSLEKVAKDGVKGFVKQFSGESPKLQAKKATEAMMDAAIKGATDKTDDVEEKFEYIADKAVDAMSSKTLKSNASQAGKDLVTGFANGISAQTFEAESKAKAMAKAALKAAKEALDEHSPSKEFYKVGAFAGQGLTNALGDYESKSFESGYSIAEYAKNGLSKAIGKVNDLLNTDMSAQPTIRPVLDLSDVSAGAGTISGLFNNPSIGVAANLSAINSMMNENQNGGNSDIISAIDKLSKGLNNIGGTVYNVNGITYDDGSNISNAVRDIVRAARVERRI